MVLYDDEINAERDVELDQAKRTIDALVAALEEAKEYVLHFESERGTGADLSTKIDAALALARGEG